MIGFIDDHRGAYGVEPICKVLPIAPSTYHEHVARRTDPGKLPARAKRDLELKPQIERVFGDNFEVYGARKVWRQMLREGFDVARCTVERLMAELGLQGVIRGKPLRTTVQVKAAPCPLDHVNRVFHAPAPNMLWVSDFTYVSTWSGFVYVAFVIDALCSADRRLEGVADGPCQLRARRAEAVRTAIVQSMSELPATLRQSLTWDQGAEMAQHARLRIKSGLQVYFCDPQSPWQRGSNENTNGLLRQYFPKGTDLSRHSTGELAAVAHAMNERPRKTLGWKTPIEVLDQFLAQQYDARVATTG